MSDVEPGHVAAALREHGHALLPDLLDAAEIARARSAIEALVDRAAAGALYAPASRPLDRPDIPAALVLTPTGLTVTGLHRATPELAPLILRPRLLAAIRAALGDSPHLEVLGAAISDRTRPFFGWHTHIDAEEEWTRLEARRWPDKPTLERIVVVLYLDDLDDEGGPLIVWPRRLGDPTAPPHDTLAQDWPGQVVLRPRAGTAVLLEQCTWHAARSRRHDGHRIFLGAYFCARDARSPAWAAPDLDALIERA